MVGGIRGEGPVGGSDCEGGKGDGGWVGWGDTKRALEWLFWAGHITTATRRASFERVYDVSERVIPAAILALPTPAEADAKRALVALAARAPGIATAADMRDSFRLDPTSAPAAVQEWLEDDALVPGIGRGACGERV